MGEISGSCLVFEEGKEVQSKEGEGEGEEAVFEMTGGRSDSAPTATMEPPSV